MLLAYYSKAYAGQHIFDGLKITDEDNRDSYLKHLNRYDVIYLDMNSLRVKYSEYAKDEALQVKGVTAFADYLKYAIIEDLKENADYAVVIGKSRKAGKKRPDCSIEGSMRIYQRKIYPDYGRVGSGFPGLPE